MSHVTQCEALIGWHLGRDPMTAFSFVNMENLIASCLNSSAKDRENYSDLLNEYFGNNDDDQDYDTDDDYELPSAPEIDDNDSIDPEEVTLSERLEQACIVVPVDAGDEDDNGAHVINTKEYQAASDFRWVR